MPAMPWGGARTPGGTEAEAGSPSFLCLLDWLRHGGRFCPLTLNTPQSIRFPHCILKPKLKVIADSFPPKLDNVLGSERMTASVYSFCCSCGHFCFLRHAFSG